jgi:hypothetical protein
MTLVTEGGGRMNEGKGAVMVAGNDAGYERRLGREKGEL